jgi:hypothetical protein
MSFDQSKYRIMQRGDEYRVEIWHKSSFLRFFRRGYWTVYSLNDWPRPDTYYSYREAEQAIEAVVSNLEKEKEMKKKKWHTATVPNPIPSSISYVLLPPPRSVISAMSSASQAPNIMVGDALPVTPDITSTVAAGNLMSAELEDNIADNFSRVSDKTNDTVAEPELDHEAKEIIEDDKNISENNDFDRIDLE